MKIGIELRQIVLGSSGGILVHLKGLLKALLSQYRDENFFLFCTIFNREVFEELGGNVEVVTLPTYSFFDEVDRICAEEKIQALFRSYPIEGQLNFPINKQVFFIPDLQHEAFGKFFSNEILRRRRLAFNYALSKAGAIGTNSEYTRQTLLAHEWTACRDIFVMNPGLSDEFQKARLSDLSEEERAVIPEKDFFLYPANLWPHKNHQRTLEAFSSFLRETGREVEFIFTGNPEGWETIRTRFSHLPIRHLGFVGTSLLKILYQKASALVFFSLYEGFGIPLLEAFYSGTPVICSNTTSLPEIGGDAVLSCDPTDVAAMSRLMCEIVENAALREILVQKGKERLGRFSWVRSATNLMEALRRVGNDRAEVKTACWTTGNHYPLVSIVTPSYNQGRFLRYSIESVLNQSYPHIEYVVIDGGSSDESVEILKSYGNKFKWVSEPDEGQTDAINKGFRLIRGDIRAYLNSDDVLLPKSVERIVDYLNKNPEVDLVYGDAYYIDENGKITGKYNTAEYSFSRLMQDCCICQPAAFWRTRIAKKVGLFDKSLNYVMDYDYWLRIDRIGGIIMHIPDMLACSRLYPETKTLSARREIYREIFKICQKHGGYVDLNYFYGLWHHLIIEGGANWCKFLRFLPFSHKLLARLHHRLYQLRWYSAKDVLKFFSGKLKNRLPDRPWINWGLEHLLGPLFTRMIDRRLVVGFWGDNWLAPSSSIFLGNTERKKKFILVGSAAVDTNVTVRVGRRVVCREFLKANKCERICFDASQDLQGIISIRFSRHIVDPISRKLSFRLKGTNMFTENDIFLS